MLVTSLLAYHGVLLLTRDTHELAVSAIRTEVLCDIHN